MSCPIYGSVIFDFSGLFLLRFAHLREKYVQLLVLDMKPLNYSHVNESNYTYIEYWVFKIYICVCVFIYILLKKSEKLLSGLAVHITAQSQGTGNPKPPLADEYLTYIAQSAGTHESSLPDFTSQVSPSGWRGIRTPVVRSRTRPANLITLNGICIYVLVLWQGAGEPCTAMGW